MVLTFKQLQDKVLGWLDETEDSTVVVANVQEAIAAANATRAVQYPYRFMRKNATLEIVEGTTEYQLEADFDRPIYFFNSTRNVPMEQTPFREMDIHEAPWTKQDPNGVNFTIEGSTLRLLYIPTTDEVISYAYYRQPIELTEEDDLPDIPYPYSRVLIYDALLELGAYSEDITPDKIMLWQKKQIELEASLLTRELDRQSLGSGAEYVRYVDFDAGY